MTKLLFRKMVRDMKKSMTAYLLCVVIVAIGFCGYSVLELCYDNLVESRDIFYFQSNFCDGFAKTADASLSERRILEQIGGIEKVDGRLVKDIRVHGYDDDVKLHLVSWLSLIHISFHPAAGRG